MGAAVTPSLGTLCDHETRFGTVHLHTPATMKTDKNLSRSCQTFIFCVSGLIAVAVILLVVCAVAAVPLPDQEQVPVHAESPQSAYLGLPSGSDGIVGPIDISFSCAHRNLGYYADVGNECKIFHVCNPVLLTDGQVAMMQYSFVCPNGTLFDQQTLTCTVPPGTAPCVQAESFYYLNRHVGQAGPGRRAHRLAPPSRPSPSFSVRLWYPSPSTRPPSTRPPVHHTPVHEAPRPPHPCPPGPPSTTPPVHQQELAHPAPSKPAVGDDSVIRPASYYGGKSS
ncbi:hypothetical protein MTO96_002473 [Rhipicephalus appendiculatus]